MGFNLKNGILCLCLIVLTLLVSFGVIAAVQSYEPIDNITVDSIDVNLTDGNSVSDVSFADENNVSNVSSDGNSVSDVSFADENNVDNVALSLGNEFTITVCQSAFGPTWSISPESYGVDLIRTECYSDPSMGSPLSTPVIITYHFKPTDEHYYLKLIQSDRDGHIWDVITRSN